jgi:hypothetical protein
MISATRLAASEPTSPELLTPKLVSVFQEGYGAAKFRRDVIAGLTGLRRPVVRFAPSVADARIAAQHSEAAE